MDVARHKQSSLPAIGDRGWARLGLLLLLAAALGALAAAWAPGSVRAASVRAATLTGPTGFPAGTNPNSVAVGDLNGDSDPDLAVANYVSNDVTILLGGAGGGFTPAAGSPLAAGANPVSVAVGDFNGDSNPDLAVANNGSGDVTVLLGGTGASFTPAAGSPLPAGSGPISVAVGDFNGDSDPDLAVANEGSNDVTILLGGTGASFTPAAGSPLPAGANPVSVAVGDFNRDSDPDLAVANSGSGDVTILLGGTGASFGPAAGSPVAVGSLPQAVAVGNFNGDSDPDLAVANYSSGDVSILLGGTGASFTPAAGSPVPAGTNPHSVAVGDFNGDSDPDLAVANFGSENVSILLGGTGASFTPAAGSPIPAGTDPISVAVGDFNGDSYSDLAVASESSGNAYVLLGGAGVSFTPAAGGPLAAGSFPVSVAVGDFNGDSDPDLAIANFGSDDVSILLGGAGASFTPAAGSPVPVGSLPQAVTVGDFNGDSDPDLAVANFGSNDVSILLGGAGASFTPAPQSPVPVGLNPVSVAVGDFNGDSDPDLAVANLGSDNVTILLGGAGASFMPAAGSPYPAGTNPHSVAIGDFNGDSDPDLAVGNFGSSDVSILVGAAGASFTPAAGSPVRAGVGPVSVAIGDFNGDSDPDLAVANYDSRDVSILLGGAGASFAQAARSPLAAGGCPDSIVVGEFNRDSDPDLAVANESSNYVSILLGGAGSSFTPAAGYSFVPGSFPHSLAVGDFNRDRKLDLAVANEGSNEVSILLGTKPLKRKHRPSKPGRGHDRHSTPAAPTKSRASR